MRHTRTLARTAAVLVSVLIMTACSSTKSAEPTSPSKSSPSASPTPTTTVTSTTSSVSPTPTPTPTPSSTPPPAPPAVDVLNGGKVHGGPAIAVKIDNTAKAFPQYGVSQADVVYVELVEGGLTRLIALYQSALPEQVGPVRSVRSTDSTLLANMGSICLAFSGGAGGPLDKLAETPLKDCSHGKAPGYWRSNERSGTYNLMLNLNQAVTGVGGVATAASPGFVFAADDPRVAANGPGTTASVRFPAMTIGANFVDGAYQMSHGGKRYVDADGTPVRADNVLLFLSSAQPDGVTDTAGTPSMFTQSLGSGTFVLLRDGHALGGTWNRANLADPFTFTENGGKPVAFKPGKTWVLLVPTNVASHTFG